MQEKMKQRVIINRRLNLDGTWQEYVISPSHTYAKLPTKYVYKTFSSVSEVINYYKLESVRELGVKYSYDNKGRKYGIEEYEAYLKQTQCKKKQ
jgi:hypothetical protein|tara:strand:- start:20 stop:301 length:282 start_codon:yes stop_codon:yes gene_type:complete